MKKYIYLSIVVLFLSVSLIAQEAAVTGKLTGRIAKMVKEVQMIRDGKMQKFTVDSTNQQFSGKLKLQEPQFIEIKAGNTQSQYYYLVPGESFNITIDKPSLQQSVISISGNAKGSKLQTIYQSYYKALESSGIDLSIKDWHQILFLDNSPLNKAEVSLDAAMKAESPLVNAIPKFKQDMQLSKLVLRRFTEIDTMSFVTIESNLRYLQAAKLGRTAVNIPFMKEYVTDLTNAYAARTLEKYGVVFDAIKQKNISQFIAAEAVQKYITDQGLKNYLYGEKLKIELAVNGLKNQAYVDFLLNNSDQFVRDFYADRLSQLTKNKLPDLNKARKRAFDFTLQDASGKVYRLDNFKGKMVFVDFWASWCAPCRAQIPYQRELEKAYEGKDVVFLSVSLDKSKEDWLKAVKEEDLHGYVLHAEGDFRNPFPKAYIVDAIPRYLLIDAAGNVISDNMMKPQNKKEISAIFDEELYAKNTQGILEKHFQAIGADKLQDQGLYFEYVQSLPGMKSNNKLWFKYPNQLKNNFQFEANEQMKMILGADYFKPRYSLLSGDKFVSNFPAQSDVKGNWVNRIYGFDLYLRKQVFGAVVKFAEENNNEKDSAYVLKLNYKDYVEKYYINKRTFLIDKFVLFSNKLEPRKGGGYFETFTTYSDYRNIQGVMIPFKVNQANILTIKLDKAELMSIEPSFFDTKQPLINQ